MGMPGPQKINRYELEFKLRAVRNERAAWRAHQGCRRVALHPSLHPLQVEEAGQRRSAQWQVTCARCSRCSGGTAAARSRE